VVAQKRAKSANRKTLETLFAITKQTPSFEDLQFAGSQNRGGLAGDALERELLLAPRGPGWLDEL